MTRTRLVLSVSALTLLSGLLGCDVAVVAILAARGNKKSTSNSTPGPDLSFRLWVAELGAIAGSTEQGTIDANNGDPDQSKWTQLPSATTSGEYTMPTPKAGGFDSILIQATDAQIYEVDSFEIIDATGTTIETAGATNTFSNSEITALALKDAQGPPNGVGTLTNATSTKRSFIFMKRSTPITTFRVNLWQQNAARISGDVEWSRTYNRPGDQQAGGADVNSIGTTYISFREGSTLLMLRYDMNGAIVLDTPGNNELSPLELTAPSVGSAAIAVDKANDGVFIATTRNAGDIALYRFTSNNRNPDWSFPVLSGSGVDRVEHNGLAINSAGELIVAGGADAGAPTGVNHYLSKNKNTDGSYMWSLASPPPPAPPSDNADTYWYAVATDGTQDIFTTGNLTSLVVPGNPEIYSSRVLDTNTALVNGSVTETWNDRSRGTGTAPARGQAIAVDGNHNVYVAGFCTGTSLDSVILKYASGSPAPTNVFTLTRAGNDEFLDIAADVDGTIYATGYETNGAQGEDFVLYKIAPDATIVWKRTLDFANLADRGAKVMIASGHVIVVGQVGVAAGNLDIHVRKYVK